MNDAKCIRFLQWALPRLRMRWPGFRKVRKQVCKRIGRRMRELDLPDIEAYQHFLEAQPGEWIFLDRCCRITISRFYRDIRLFETIGKGILPSLVKSAKQRDERDVRCWTAGSASGEEPYTLAILWRLMLESTFPEFSISIMATDADPNMIERARTGRYSKGSLKDLPLSWRDQAFEHRAELFQIRDEYRTAVEFRQQDLRREMPTGQFDLILCRNLAFTYFDETLQKEILSGIVDRLRPYGFLVIGQHESLPELPRHLSEEWSSMGTFVRDCPRPEGD